MVSKLLSSPVFFEMAEAEIQECIHCSGAKWRTIEKNEIIFTQLDIPEYVYILTEGAVIICKDSISGKRGIVTSIDRCGDIFGEVYVFKEKSAYDYYTLATQKSIVLEMPKAFFYQTCSDSCGHHSKLIRNMLGILAQKAYFLNQKLQLLSSGSLRQKIVKHLLENQIEGRYVVMTMNREEFADYLNVARPSLSRELIKMKDENLIVIKGNKINIVDLEALEGFL